MSWLVICIKGEIKVRLDCLQESFCILFEENKFIFLRKVSRVLFTFWCTMCTSIVEFVIYYRVCLVF